MMTQVESKEKKTVTNVGEDEIQLVSRLCKVGGDASHRCRRVHVGYCDELDVSLFRDTMFG